ncbi:MAG: hypothetical protein Q8R79_04955 [Legionellaceae bacterium]|nr:hypothetical protein [Legionellaceae bacterium]
MTKLQQLHDSLYNTIVSYFYILNQQQVSALEKKPEGVLQVLSEDTSSPLPQNRRSVSASMDVLDEEPYTLAFEEKLNQKTESLLKKTQNLCALIDELHPNEYEKPVLHYLTHFLVAVQHLLETSTPLMEIENLSMAHLAAKIVPEVTFDAKIFLLQHFQNIKTLLETTNTVKFHPLVTYNPGELNRAFECYGLCTPAGWLSSEPSLSSESVALTMTIQRGLTFYLQMEPSTLAAHIDAALQEQQARVALQEKNDRITELEKELEALSSETRPEKLSKPPEKEPQSIVTAVERPDSPEQTESDEHRTSTTATPVHMSGNQHTIWSTFARGAAWAKKKLTEAAPTSDDDVGDEDTLSITRFNPGSASSDHGDLNHF